MQEYRATFRRTRDGETRNPRFKTGETNPAEIKNAAFEALLKIPFLAGGRHDWQLVGITRSQPKIAGRSRILTAAPIVDALLARLNRGDYPPAQEFPKQQSIRQEFNASQQAVFAAFETLRDHGYIETRGSGSARRTRVRPRKHWRPLADTGQPDPPS